jgi:gamma-glutamylaminecyclotransferase
MGVKRRPGYHLRAMPSASVHLFVYGSLKRGGRHHDELDGATFLGLAETGPGYRLEPLGEYLALVPAAGEGCVPGELFQVSLAKLPDLDAFEGDAYVRREVPVRLVPAASARPPRARPTGQTADSAETRFALAYLRKAR